MRVRTFINRLVWLVILAYAGYAAIAVGSSYLQVRSLVEQAVDEASRRPRTAAAVTQPAVALQESSQVPLELCPMERCRRGGSGRPPLGGPDLYAQDVTA